MEAVGTGGVETRNEVDAEVLRLTSTPTLVVSCHRQRSVMGKFVTGSFTVCQW